jgi:hypothetical protein
MRGRARGKPVRRCRRRAAESATRREWPAPAAFGRASQCRDSGRTGPQRRAKPVRASGNRLRASGSPPDTMAGRGIRGHQARRERAREGERESQGSRGRPREARRRGAEEDRRGSRKERTTGRGRDGGRTPRIRREAPSINNHRAGHHIRHAYHHRAAPSHTHTSTINIRNTPTSETRQHLRTPQPPAPTKIGPPPPLGDTHLWSTTTTG